MPSRPLYPVYVFASGRGIARPTVLKLETQRSGAARRSRSSGWLRSSHGFLNGSLKRDWICDGRQSHIIHARTVDLYVPHVEEPSEEPLFEPDLFDGTELQIGNVTTKQAAFENHAMVGDRDLRSPHGNH